MTIMKLENYLKHLQDDMGIGVSAAAGIGARVDNFPSIPKKKKKQVLRVSYPNESVKPTLSRRVMVDLDRTIHKYSKSWYDGTLYDEPFEGAKEALEWLKSKGFEIVIFTTRASIENVKEHGETVEDQIISIENWLTNYGIPYDRITADKISADFYIDDKAIHIKNGDWKSVKGEIEKRMAGSFL